MNARVPSLKAPSAVIAFELDGRKVEAQAGETLLQVAQRHQIAIPHLCYRDGLRADGNCRVCVVEIEGERTLAPSCCRMPSPGAKVRTSSDRARAAQKMVLELLLSDMPDTVHREDSELNAWAGRLGVGVPRFPSRQQPVSDVSHPAIAVNLDACIQCGRCARACREEQVNDVIGYAWRGDAAQIVFDLDDPLGASTCVGCGECVQACPTGALMPKLLGAAASRVADDAFLAASAIAPRRTETSVDSVCPYCGVGCQLTYHVTGNQIIHVEGRPGPANQSRLCVKGRFGFDYVSSADRLNVPLIRRADAPKRLDTDRVPADWRASFREASWDEALSLVAANITGIRDRHGADALAGFGSAKGSNEEAYLFQKLIRTGFGTHNVDHCTRLCHASSVVALLEGIGSGAVSNQVADVAQAEVIVVIGANPTVNHPVAATWIKNAVKQGAKLIVADPRRNGLARFATHMLQFRADTDVALLNAMLHVVIEEGLVDQSFVSARTAGFDELRKAVQHTSPEAMAPICGIDAQTIREVARVYATSRASMILWGMGVSQHTHGTDNARCLIALALATGQIGRPGTGLHPLRGQNNVQGASDAGLIPMMLPDYQRTSHERVLRMFEQFWAQPLSRAPGLTVVEIIKAAQAGRVRGMYIVGENPAMSDPDLSHARAALASLEFLVVQDIFPTETVWLADVILPASAHTEKTGTFTNTDRLVQIGRAALLPPGQARQDLAIIVDLAKRLGLDWRYAHARDVFEEMRGCMPSIAGISWDRLEREGAVVYPCTGDDDPGEAVVFKDHFPTDDGRARFVPVSLRFADELPDTEYPFVLITGRELEHWHTGSMTRRAQALDAIAPEPTASMHPKALERLGLAPADRAVVRSRRGAITLKVRADSGLAQGDVFIPFAYAEAAANALTNAALDPAAKIPELKYCAVQVERAPRSS